MRRPYCPVCCVSIQRLECTANDDDFTAMPCGHTVGLATMAAWNEYIIGRANDLLKHKTGKGGG